MKFRNLVATLTLTLGTVGLTSGAQAIFLDFSDSAAVSGYTNRDIENNGSFTWTNVDGSSVNVTLAVTGGSSDVNDFAAASGLFIGLNDGAATGQFHVYTLSFSKPVRDLMLTIVNVNVGPVGPFDYNDQLVFTGAPTFPDFGGGVTTSGNTVNPGAGGTNAQFVTVQFDDPLTSFSVTHGLGTAGAPNPGFIVFPSLTFNVVVPEPGALALFGLGLAGIGFAARRKRKAA